MTIQLTSDTFSLYLRARDVIEVIYFIPHNEQQKVQQCQCAMITPVRYDAGLMSLFFH